MKPRVFCVGSIKNGVLKLLFERPKPTPDLDKYRLDGRPKDLDGRPVKGGAR